VLESGGFDVIVELLKDEELQGAKNLEERALNEMG
jgi:hypothetical protein